MAQLRVCLNIFVPLAVKSKKIYDKVSMKVNRE